MKAISRAITITVSAGSLWRCLSPRQALVGRHELAESFRVCEAKCRAASARGIGGRRKPVGARLVGRVNHRAVEDSIGVQR